MGKPKAGINTFYTYALSSKSACYSCHVRTDGNASHEPEVNDVDPLMCHNDSYQRKVVSDPVNTETVINIDGVQKTYPFGFVGHEVKVANVKPGYQWFDGTSYVYNVGEEIIPSADGTYTMAKHLTKNLKLFPSRTTGQ